MQHANACSHLYTVYRLWLITFAGVFVSANDSVLHRVAACSSLAKYEILCVKLLDEENVNVQNGELHQMEASFFWPFSHAAADRITVYRPRLVHAYTVLLRLAIAFP
jgi:hypothetical protein